MPNKIKLILKFFVIFPDIIYNCFKVAYKIVTNKKINSYISYQQVTGDDLEITLTANFITLTPGTICIEASNKQLAIHHFD